MFSDATITSTRSWLDEAARRYYGPLVRFFRRRIRNPQDADDLVQQVFLRLSQHPQVDAIGNRDAYIFQMASNALKDHCRRKRVWDRLLVASERWADADRIDAEADPGVEISPERVLQGRECINQLEAALRELPERTRDVFALRCFEGLKHAEIARLYGISVRAVEKHFAKALAHLSHRVDHGQGGSP